MRPGLDRLEVMFDGCKASKAEQFITKSPPGLVSFGGLATIEDDLQSAQTWSH